MQTPPFMSCGPGLPPVTTPEPVTFVSTISQHPVDFTQRQGKTMTILSGLQIAIGLLCAIIFIALISVQRKLASGKNIDSVVAGVWCGGLYIIAGSLGVAASRQNRLSLMISSMVFSILSTVILWGVVDFLDAAIDRVSEDTHCHYYFCTIYNYNGYGTAGSALIILSVIELIFSFWCSVLSCIGSCKICYGGSSSGRNYVYPAEIVYVNFAGQQVICVQQVSVAGGQVMNGLPNQPFPVNTQLLLNGLLHTTGLAAAAAAPPATQPGVRRLPEDHAAYLKTAHANNDDKCSQHDEVTKDKIAYGH